MPRLGVLCGGSGSSKFVRGIHSVSGSRDYEVGYIANVGDNFWHWGLWICPDIDILLYNLASRLDISKGWGVDSDSFMVKRTLQEIGESSSWFGLGDIDLALSLRRTQLIQRGWSLTSITTYLCEKLGLPDIVIPSTDDYLQTFVQTRIGLLHLQEFWVKNAATVEVRGIRHIGIENSSPSTRFTRQIESKVIMCPANPITSILPSVNLPGVREKLKGSRVVAVSPFVGKNPVSGPAAILMRALNMETTSLGIARLYSDFLDVLVMDSSDDREVIKKVRDEGVEVLLTNTILRNRDDEIFMAKELFDLL